MKNRKKIRLSQCMIVKNEEKNIRRALSWGKDIVCEQIIVDTGSTDRTVEIAEELGAKVFHFEWIDDFSAAKNYAIEQASGEWIAFLDADEYFTEVSVQKILPTILKVEKGGYNGRQIVAIATELMNIDKNGRPGVSGHQIRIFRNTPKLRYKNRIHEELEFAGHTAYDVFDARKDLTIYHTGYTKEAFEQTGKSQRNLRMLKKELEDDPENVEILIYLGDSYMTDNSYDKARESFHEALKYATEKEDIPVKGVLRSASMLLILYARDYMPEQENTVREIYEKYQEIHSDHPDADCYFGAWLYQNKSYEEAAGHLKAALDKFKRYKGDVQVYMSANLKMVYAQLGDCCRRQKQYEDAVRYFTMSLGVDRYYTEALVMILNLFKREEGESDTAAGTWTLLSHLYNMSSLKDQMMILKGAKLASFPVLEERIYGVMPEEQRRIVKEALAKKTEEKKSADQ